MSIRIDGSGDVTQSKRLWRNENQPQSIGSGVFVDGYVYRPNAVAGKGIQCIEPRSGKIVWSKRTRAAYWGSIVLAGGRMYVTDQDGTTSVLRPNANDYDEEASNELGEPSNSTPAISDGQIFIRTFEHLYCIGEAGA